MSTVFELIINEEIPGKFVWADELCVAIATIEPVTTGHVLVIPREPISKWTDLPPNLLEHLMRVSQIIGKAAEKAFDAPRTALLIAGFEVPHTHIHVIPAHGAEDASLAKAHAVPESEIADAAHALRDVLRAEGYSKRIPMLLDSPAVP